MITQLGELPFVFSVPCARAVAFLVWSCTMCGSGSRTVGKQIFVFLTLSCLGLCWIVRVLVKKTVAGLHIDAQLHVSASCFCTMYRERGAAAEEVQITGPPAPEVLKRISFSSSKGVRSPERNMSLKNNTGFIGDTLRCRPSAPCETCCPWNCFHTVVKLWALTAELCSWRLSDGKCVPSQFVHWWNGAGLVC